ncbi:hypothetical protein [Paraburkholderia aspalathi]|uniref:hypothetical protein n=1 Tax=Paraburkholderia aspalathi TaxID=1324617 RepID=UPI0038B70A88
MSGDDFYMFDLQLSDRETFFVGKIVTLWGALEYEIFNQTLLTYDEEGMSVDKLPKALKGQQFSDILDLWYERVVANAKPKPKRVLEDQYKAITHYQTYRNALVHGMLDYVATDIGRLLSMRVKKKEFVTVQFTGDELGEFARALQSINFKIRYPRGPNQYAMKLSRDGLHVSRRAAAALTGHPVADELMPRLPKDDLFDALGQFPSDARGSEG